MRVRPCCSNVAKTDQKANVVLVDNVPLFFQLRDGPYFPTLKLLHKYPDCMAKLRVDKGAIKFVFGGANIMCPGLTSPGAVRRLRGDARARVWGVRAGARAAAAKRGEGGDGRLGHPSFHLSHAMRHASRFHFQRHILFQRFVQKRSRRLICRMACEARRGEGSRSR